MRSRRIALVSHCILNQNTVLRDWERASGPFRSVVSGLLEEGFSIIQLPCPEVTYKGVNRPPMTYEDYDTEAFRSHCRKLLVPTVLQLQRLHEDSCRLEVLYGIENSPNCDVRQGRGVLMEELIKLLPPNMAIENLRMVPESYSELPKVD